MGDTEAMRQALERIADGQCRADDLRHCGCLLNVQIAKETLAALASTEAPGEGTGWWCTEDCGCPCGDPAPVGERVPEGWHIEWRWERGPTVNEVVYGTFDPVNVPVLVPDTPYEGEQ